MNTMEAAKMAIQDALAACSRAETAVMAVKSEGAGCYSFDGPLFWAGVDADRQIQQARQALVEARERLSGVAA